MATKLRTPLHHAVDLLVTKVVESGSTQYVIYLMLPDWCRVTLAVVSTPRLAQRAVDIFTRKLINDTEGFENMLWDKMSSSWENTAEVKFNLVAQRFKEKERIKDNELSKQSKADDEPKGMGKEAIKRAKRLVSDSIAKHIL